MQSVVATYQGLASSLARLTANNPGVAVRIQVADDNLDDGLDLNYEMIGGNPDLSAEVVRLIEDHFNGTAKVTQDRPGLWRAFVCLHDLDALKQHPLYGIMLDHRQDADRVLMVFEEGQCIQRIDFDADEAGDVEGVANALRQSAKAAGLDCMVRTANLGRSLEDWEPLVEP